MSDSFFIIRIQLQFFLFQREFVSQLKATSVCAPVVLMFCRSYQGPFLKMLEFFPYQPALLLRQLLFTLPRGQHLARYISYRIEFC